MCCQIASRFFLMRGNHFFEQAFVFIVECIEHHHLHVAVLHKSFVHIPHISNSTAHARCKVSAGVAKYYNCAACHVFTTVITHTFHHHFHTTITHSETLACHAADESF